MTEKMYAAAQAQANAQAEAQGENGGATGEDGTFDADYTEVNEDDK